jgi:hypothetical protein
VLLGSGQTRLNQRFVEFVHAQKSFVHIANLAKSIYSAKRFGLSAYDPPMASRFIRRNEGSTPDAAEVYVDGAFVGNATETLKLPAGKHTIKVTLAGYKDWTKDLTVLANSELKLNAALEKQ